MASGEEDQTRVGGGERVNGAVRLGQTPLFLGVYQEFLEHVSREGTRFTEVLSGFLWLFRSQSRSRKMSQTTAVVQARVKREATGHLVHKSQSHPQLHLVSKLNSAKTECCLELGS